MALAGWFNGRVPGLRALCTALDDVAPPLTEAEELARVLAAEAEKSQSLRGPRHYG